MRLAALSAWLLASSAIAAPDALVKRSVTCASISIPTTAAAQAALFCSEFLAIRPVTVTAMRTATVVRTITVPTIVTTSAYLTLSPTTFVPVTKYTITATTGPAASTITSIVPSTTQTAYLDDTTSTVTVMRKRSMSGQSILPRYMQIPTYFASYVRADISSACSCLSLPTPTITRILAARPVITIATLQFSRVLKVKSTLALVTANVTIVNVRTETITPPVPTQTLLSGTYLAQAFKCPPSHPATSYLCPRGTALDNGLRAGFENCAITTPDNYTGFCLYSSVNGTSALAGTTVLASTVGATRFATYGNPPADCPTRADYSCV